MYVDVSTIKTNGKTYTRYLLRESFRENGKVKHRTLINLKNCKPTEIQAIRLALSHKQDLAHLGSIQDNLSIQQGRSFGAVWLLHQLAKREGIMSALGTTPQAKLALWQVIARVIDQGSRLSAVRLAHQHAACEIIGITKSFDEDELYANLDWLSQEQNTIEDRLFKQANKQTVELFLYDVTSSYFEGKQNELAAFGYNRDGKKGKLQIVVGLLCDAKGTPLSVEVFEGNTQDPKTVAAQVEKVVKRFGAKSVTFVGDRGMIKSQQIELLSTVGFHYITAITRPQIEKLIVEGTFQLGLFDEQLAEIFLETGIRYVLRRNPIRALEIATTREEKYQALLRFVLLQNQHLKKHPKAKPETAFNKVKAKSKSLRIADWVLVESLGREIAMSKIQEALEERQRLDGCYCLKTDLVNKEIAKEIIHERYKDLALVELAFRTSKTDHLELRPVYVRKESRTRGHVFVVMLAYRIIRALKGYWKHLNLTVEEGIMQLGTLCVNQVKIQGQASFNQIPAPSQEIQELLDAAAVKLPKVIPTSQVVVSTKNKLEKHRK
jgi:transposase